MERDFLENKFEQLIGRKLIIKLYLLGFYIQNVAESYYYNLTLFIKTRERLVNNIRSRKCKW